VTCYLIGGAFEKLHGRIKSKYSKEWPSWPVELQYFRHLRNACFHGNLFSLAPYGNQTSAIDPSQPPSWHHFVMESDDAVKGTQAIGNALHLHQTIPFLDQIARSL